MTGMIRKSHSQDSHACDEFNRLSRRNFLATTATSAAAAAVLVSAPAWLPRVAMAKNYNSNVRDVMISLYLRGGIDGLSVLVPWGDAAYYTARPNLNVPRPDSGATQKAINLDGFFGIHPSMAPLMNAYNNQHLLFMHATGSTDTTRSHFDAQRSMETAKTGDPNALSGWLGRHILSTDPMSPGALLRAVGISTGLQKTLQGGPLTLPIPNLDGFGLTGTASTIVARSDAFESIYQGTVDPLKTVAYNTLQTIDLLNTINFAGYAPGGGAVYPNTSLGIALKSTAALIKAQVGVEAIAIDVSSWDHHNAQGVLNGTFNSMLTDLTNCLAAFYADMMSVVTNPTFTLVAMSEFGRRLRENGSSGCDHGYGNVMMLMGNCINGGRVCARLLVSMHCNSAVRRPIDLVRGRRFWMRASQHPPRTSRRTCPSCFLEVSGVLRTSIKIWSQTFLIIWTLSTSSRQEA